MGVGACLMGPLTAYRVWFQDETQQRANSWMLMTGAIGMLSSSLPVQFFFTNNRMEINIWNLSNPNSY